MITENYRERVIQFQHGAFNLICEQLDREYGPKGQGWVNIMCIKTTNYQEMKIRYRIKSMVSKWDLPDMLPVGSLEEFIELEGNKKEYELEDVELFIKIFNS